jgi:FOG: EAL domain
MTIANDLKTAIEHDELELRYWPEVDLSSGKILGMEAQVSWNHPQRGLLEAQAFLPAAEKPAPSSPSVTGCWSAPVGKCASGVTKAWRHRWWR